MRAYVELGQSIYEARLEYESIHEPTGTKVGRNEPCTCGSGKKYKKCCGTHSE
jgi:uncharacterized protein YchJ